MSIAWPLVTTVVSVWALVMGVMIVLERRSAAATIAWLLALVFLPIVGLVVYRLIGPQRLERKKLRRISGRRVVEHAMSALGEIQAHSRDDLQLALVPVRLGEAPPMRADRVEVYLDGVSAFRAIADAIDQARHHVHLEYYIWEPDQIGRRLRDQLVERARAGVEVRMILDGTGCNNLRRGFLRPLRDAGVEVAWFNPVSLRRLRRRRADFRTHRKIVVCDGRVGFTGGMNVTDVHLADLCPTWWRDTHVGVEGSAVLSMQRVFMEDWLFTNGALPDFAPAYFPAHDLGGDHIVQFVASGPDSDAFAVHKLLFAALSQARHRVWATTPYFVPDEPILAALVSAALRGVDVRLLVPRKGDSRLVDLAARSYFPELLAAGVRVFEYEARFIHAKTLVVDGDIAIIGTANLDNRSFRLNFELAAVVYGDRTAAILEDAFRADLASSRETTAADLERVPFRRRLGCSWARLVSPLL